MPYNFVSDTVHTKELVADLLQAKCDLRWKTAALRFFEPPLGAYGQRTMFILRSLKSA